jgi:hypothetical protein
VGVCVIEREARRTKGVELRADLSRELRARRRIEEKAKAGADEIVSALAVRANERRNGRWRQHGSAACQHEMKADMQSRQPAGTRDRVGGGRPADHEARAGEDAVAAPLLDGFVDGRIEAEIVGADDEPAQAQCAASRSRKNWKNSTPSRSRRTIISGLRTISPTIDAILPARK